MIYLTLQLTQQTPGPLLLSGGNVKEAPEVLPALCQTVLTSEAHVLLMVVSLAGE